MLKDLGIDWVILGHSERRTLFHETDQDVQKKLHLALNHNMNVILCVGESLEIREQGATAAFIQGQLAASLGPLSALKDIQNRLVIAYEPIWAIGTGKVASEEQVNWFFPFLNNYSYTL